MRLQGHALSAATNISFLFPVPAKATGNEIMKLVRCMRAERTGPGALTHLDQPRVSSKVEIVKGC